MERAPELEDLTRRFYQALAQGDAAVIEDLVSQREGVLNIGTDPAEWWDSAASFRRALRAQTEELAGVQVTPGELRAYREGTVGWAADRPTFRFPNGFEIPLRMTTVFHQEDGAWKVVQSHASVAARNEDVVGKPLTT
jgi:ketosteroid isomerase-like protein